MNLLTKLIPEPVDFSTLELERLVWPDEDDIEETPNTLDVDFRTHINQEPVYIHCEVKPHYNYLLTQRGKMVLDYISGYTFSFYVEDNNGNELEVADQQVLHDKIKPHLDKLFETF